MRITGNTPISTVQGKGGKKRVGGGGDGFFLSSEGEATSASTTSSASALGGIDALLALQEMEVAPDDRDIASRRGHSLLDALDALKADLLGGLVPDARLEDMVSVLKDRTPSGDEGLDSVIDEIELRVRVELAKLGKFPE
ncbi:flagellar assembly protein FliX [Pannonibacter sp. SL95]|uniref:flagellar assembly protein FliX n=1 Tax=Pannonibacter sp. SL95 TaxID=2995153 RepID=UPI0022743845|nr:flagellar assembly protein FliX [Pannonibacter sp. SL95]MCY1705718.1 flagellar assembly protein FliX [Pannonibacter sp. SL95]